MVPIFELFGKPLAIYPLMALIDFQFRYFCLPYCKRRGYDDNDMIVFLLISCIGIFFRNAPALWAYKPSLPSPPPTEPQPY